MTSCPEDPFLEFHIKRAGDWTSRLIDKMERTSCFPVAPLGTTSKPSKLTVRVDGPFAASALLPNYPIIALIGAGIGVTPTISVLKSLLLERPAKHPQRVYLYWTLRDHKVPDCLTESLRSVRSSSRRLLRGRYFLTQADPERLKQQQEQEPQQEVYAGRPQWGKELQRLQREAETLGQSQCALLFCGPKSMAKSLEEAIETIESACSFRFHLVKENSF